MAKATKQVKSSRATRKTARRKRPQRAAPLHARAAAVKKAPLPRPIFKLSPLGRELLAAVEEYWTHDYLGPGVSGSVPEEIEADEHYARAHKRISKKNRRTVERLEAAIMAQPLSLSNIADRALLWYQDGETQIEQHMPQKGRPGEEGRELLAAIVAMSDMPRSLSWGAFGERTPPDVQQRIAAIMGKRKPKPLKGVPLKVLKAELDGMLAKLAA